MSKYFGTDGFRGEANVTLTADHAFKIGRFLGWYYGRNKKAGERCRILIGKDTRLSSYMFEFSLVSGITASGADVYLMHVTTTPSVAYIVYTQNMDCGIMISASHNPYYDNGIKLINASGEKMEEETLLKVEAYIDGLAGEVPLAKGADIGRTVDFSDGRDQYMNFLQSLALKSYEGKKVGLDCANGSTWMIARKVFENLGAQVFVINDHPDGNNINKDCGSTHMEGLCRFVVEHHLDVGFAFDGDGDRCLAVDEKGNIVDGDGIIYIYGRYLKERGKLIGNKVVTTVMSNFGLYKALDAIGIEYEKTAVGDKYVYENMANNGYRIGGEQSGHIIFKKYATTGDGILTAIKIMEVMLARNTSLSQLAEPFKKYPQKLENIRVMDKETVLADPDIVGKIRAVEEALGENGRILVRGSGTEPLIRVMVEARDEDICKKYVDSIIDTIRKKGYEA
ncbi:phosphoglucosamine mutase [Catenibacillus scindens]|uniref:phosphoglucosamine mutase n=1 Tax=Catenibacillus scindens TaxID=673271 RepID=UPI00320A4D16